MKRQPSSRCVSAGIPVSLVVRICIGEERPDSRASELPRRPDVSNREAPSRLSYYFLFADKQEIKQPKGVLRTYPAFSPRNARYTD